MQLRVFFHRRYLSLVCLLGCAWPFEHALECKCHDRDRQTRVSHGVAGRAFAPTAASPRTGSARPSSDSLPPSRVPDQAPPSEPRSVLTVSRRGTSCTTSAPHVRASSDLWTRRQSMWVCHIPHLFESQSHVPDLFSRGRLIIQLSMAKTMSIIIAATIITKTITIVSITKSAPLENDTKSVATHKASSELPLRQLNGLGKLRFSYLGSRGGQARRANRVYVFVA